MKLRQISMAALLAAATTAQAQTSITPNTLNGGVTIWDHNTGASMHVAPSPWGGYNVNTFDPYRQEQQFLNDFWAPRPGDSASDIRHKSMMRSLMW